MNPWRPVRMQTARTSSWLCGLTVGICISGLPACPAQSPPASSPATHPSRASSPVVLDRVVAVVNKNVILASDVDNDIRLSILEPGRAGQGVLTRQRALQQLISRTLIQQQISQEDAGAAAPSQAQLDARLAEIRRDLPACAHANCASEAGWKAFLAAHSLTQQQVETYLRARLEILHFIEQRFRAGIRIPERRIEAYYHDTLLPQYPKGQAVPPLKQVAPRIAEILLERRVNVLFGNWLANLRKEGDVEVLDPEFAAPENSEKAAGGDH